ncbi:MAG: hypothetical protein KJ732_02755 [Candidatus Margulisbacteria bacterium]|nr:hypothetical protein [Candidatus Margulisiibacteriota bacterium]
MNKKIKHINKVKLPIIRPCPCAVNHVSCGYIVISHILGCPFNCSYCFLHTFYGKDEIVVYDNEADIVAQVSNYMKAAKKPLRIGTGQYSDSLALPEARSLAIKLVNFFVQQKDHLFELKTKSDQVDDLLTLDHKGRTVVAWSVNPEKIAASDELGAVSLGERLNAARKCVEAGYPVAFHFDPIIYYSGWADDYKEVVDLIFAEIKPQNIAWISLGALRYQPELKDIIEKRFPDSRITWEEREAGEDGKMRYLKPVRIKMFQKMNEFIRQRSKEVYVYLCMESADVWQKSGIENQDNNPYAKYFKYS